MNLADKDKNSNLFDKVHYLTHFVMRSFLIAVFCCLLIICVLVACYFGDLFLNVKSGDYKNPLFNAYVIVSPSMVPTISINDAIVVKRVDDDNYDIGDIITFSSEDANYKGLTVTHRIVNKRKVSNASSFYTTKGDNNYVNDPALVATDAIYGKVLFKIPKLGYIQNFLAKPLNFVLCILVPAFLVIIYDLSRIGIMMFKKKEV